MSLPERAGCNSNILLHLLFLLGLISSTRSNILLRLLFLSALIFSTRSETTEISFPQFSANNSTLRAFGDIQYNAENHSWIMNAKSAVTLTGTCAMLMYDGDTKFKIQDSTEGAIASFNTSFTFKFTTPPQQEVWDTNSSDTGVATTLSFILTTHPLYQLDVIQARSDSAAEQPSACKSFFTQADTDLNLFGIVFESTSNYNKGEPSNNFIGILNGVSDQDFEAGSTFNLCGDQTNCSYFSNEESFTAWIDFTPEQTLQVWLRNGSYSHVEKPARPLFENSNFQLPTNLGEYVSLLFVGSSSENHIQTHEISSWSFSSIHMPEELPSRTRKWIGLVLGVIGTVTTILVVYFFLLCLLRRRRTKPISYYSKQGPHIFSYKELCNATKNFNKNEKLGSGGFGTVYRGSFAISGIDTLLAIKRINYESMHAETTFLAEISSLRHIKHGNVVQLQGWCHEKGQLLLVYDYMANGSLNEWLHDSNGSKKKTYKQGLPLKVRHYILEGVAMALEYLHKDCPQCILHRDIKSSNVMLDADFKAHLGDFGLARLMDHQKLEKTTMAAGTIGYMAPEMPYTGKATKESDVYSFGILILEVMCGRRPLDLKAQEPEDLLLLQSVWRAYEGGRLLSVADPRLLQTYQSLRFRDHLMDESVVCAMQRQPCVTYSESLNEHNNNNLNEHSNILDIEAVEINDFEVEKMMVKNLLHLGLLCCLPNPKVRPTMRKVVRILQQIGSMNNVDYTTLIVSMPPIPDTKPLGLYRCMEFSQTMDSVE